MSPRATALAIVGAAAALVVAGTVTITWLQARGQTTHAAGVVSKPRRAPAGTLPNAADHCISVMSKGFLASCALRWTARIRCTMVSRWLMLRLTEFAVSVNGWTATASKYGLAPAR